MLSRKILLPFFVLVLKFPAESQESKVVPYSVPAPRGNILSFSEVENRYISLATSQEVSYFAINFDDVLRSNDKAQVIAHARDALGWINNMRGRYNPYRKDLGLPELSPEELSDHTIWEYYYARKWLPLRVSSVLLDKELDFLKDKAMLTSISMLPRIVRSYPDTQMAQHLIGRFSPSNPADWIRDGAIEETQFIYPKQKAGFVEIEENGIKTKKATGTGLESSLAYLLDSGTPALVEKTFTYNGENLSVSEKIIRESVPGASVVLTLDYDLQKVAEELVHDQYLKKIGDKQYSIQSNAKNLPKSIVLIDLNDMSIAAMASSPSFDLQRLSPGFGDDKYEETMRKKLKSDGELLKPFDSRAFELSFPPASTFKLVTALAGLETGTINRYTTYPCTPSHVIGGRSFKNHVDEKSALGLNKDPEYNFSQALKRSCNTWFYQMALAMSKDPNKMQRFFDIAKALGLGQLPELPIPGMGKGFMYSDINNIKIKNDDGTIRTFLYPGDIANLSIGQGDVYATPLQVAWMSARLAKPDSDRKLKIIKEIFHDIRKAPQSYEDYLAMQGQSLKTEALNTRINNFNITLIQNAMYSVVNGTNGTATRVNSGLSYGDMGPAVAAKTGTGQWNGKNVAWLTGFFPFYAPRYAFTVFVEGVEGVELSGGGTAAPLLNAFLSDPEVMKKLQAHKESVEVFNLLMPNLEEQSVMRAVPVYDAVQYEEPQENSPYLQEEDPRRFRENNPQRTPFLRRLFKKNPNRNR